MAFDVLRRVYTQDAYADEALRAQLTQAVRADDAALATDLTMGVLRWQRLLDFLIDRHLTRTAKPLDMDVRIALRLGMYQLWFLDRVPASAAVNESVELVKRARKRSATTLVNAVLRKAAQHAGSFPRAREEVAAWLPQEMSGAEHLGILYSHPAWLIERWTERFGEERTRALLEANNRVPRQSFYVSDAAHQADAIASLEQAGCVVEHGVFLKQAWTLAHGNPAASEALQLGGVTMQDEASQAAGLLADVQPGNTVLDLCAAPGGKTLLLARAAGPQGRVLAADLHPHRVRQMAARFERAGIRNIESVHLDGTQPLQLGRLFDRVLVDAPCTGTGTLARHPEIRWRLRPDDLTDLHARQVLLLRNALAVLAPSGRLVYSTCSFEPEENECVVREALDSAAHTVRLVSPGSVLQSMLRDTVSTDSVMDSEGFFRTFPPEHGTDGFVAAVIERIA